MFDFIYWLLSYVVPFLAVLTVIVFVHEMGHYLVARWNGVAIQAFSIGFGRELIGWNDKHGTRWKISAIPLGGYVRFVGDMNAASVPDPDAVANIDPALAPHLFANKNVWQRISIVAAGPLANVLLTFLILYALLLGYGRYTIPPVVGEVLVGSVAEAAGVQAGDIVVSVAGYVVRGFEDFQRMVATSPARPVTVEIERGSELQTLVIDVTLDLGPAEVHGLSDTINYETVAASARRIIAEGHVGLVETFAERLALHCLEDARVLGVTVRIDKPDALEAADGAGCELTYRR